MNTRSTCFVVATAALTMSTAANAGLGSFDIALLSQSDDFAELDVFGFFGYEWGTTDYLDFNSDDGLPDIFHIEINSSASQLAGYQYQLTLDYSSYDIGYFLNGSGPGRHVIGLNDIITTGTISDAAILDASGNPVGEMSIGGSGGSLFLESDIQGLLDAIGPNETDLITFYFNTVPAPSSLALLGFAGLAGCQRRRSY